MVLMDESPEIFDGFYANILGKLTQGLGQETNLDLVGYNLKTMLSISLNLELVDIPKWKGCTELVLDKCKLLIEHNEEERLISIVFSLMDSLDPT